MRTFRAVNEAPGLVIPRTSASRAALIGLSVFAASLGVSATALAQDPGPPPSPPPGFEQQPPPGYGAPPPGYYPPPGYGYPAPQGAMLGPKEMDYEEGDPVPAGYHVDTKIRKGLVIGGAVTFGTLYLLSAFTAAVADEATTSSNYVPLYIPGIGPFITIGTARSSGAGTFSLIIDGIGQSGGIAMAIAGIALPRTQLVRNDVGAITVQVAPVSLGNGTMGLGFVGTM